MLLVVSLGATVENRFPIARIMFSIGCLCVLLLCLLVPPRSYGFAFVERECIADAGELKVLFPRMDRLRVVVDQCG